MTIRLLLSWVLLTPLAAAQAAPQFSQAQCQKLNEERLAVRKQLRQPYSAEQGEQLKARQQELLRLLQTHCRQPVKVPPVPAPSENRQPVTG